VRNPAGQLPHRLHLLGLQQRRLRLLTGVDLGPKPFIGCGKFPGPPCYRALELFAVARQRCGGVAKLIADLIQFTHAGAQWAAQWIDRLALA
jgi:hypothetical protein